MPSDPNALYLGYVDGAWATYSAVKARFPHNTVLSVTTTGFTKADICDVETGDATPEIAAAGIRNGLYHTIYSNRSVLPQLVKAIGNMHWNWYAADWTGTPHLVPNSVATQYAAPGSGSPGNYDISITDGSWPYPPAPTPPPSGFDTDLMETLMTLASSKQDAFNALVRDWWATYRTDTLTVPALQYLQAGYAGPWAGSVDFVLACIIDTAKTTGHLRPQYAGAA